MRHLATLLLAACATTPAPHAQPPGSRGLHATEHLDPARDPDEAGRQAASYPDTRPYVATGHADHLMVGTPWVRHWDSADEHVRLAAMHRSAAAQIHDEFEQACGTRAEAEIRVSPLVKYGV